MSVYKQKGSKNWWYKFTWHGRQIRESTKQLNKRVAEQIEAGHKVSLAKAEVGIRDKKPVPTLREFIDNDFTPFVESRFANKPKTLEYRQNGLKNLREFGSIRWPGHRSMRSPETRSLRLSASAVRLDSPLPALTGNLKSCGGC